MILGIILLYLACSAAPASARYDCDPFEGGTPQSSKKCPCSDEPNSKYYCASAVQYTMLESTQKVNALFISILEFIARTLWLAARFIANLAEALLRGQVWQTIRTGLLEQLQTIMGGESGVLARVTGGGNGLFLVALLLAGLVMAFPLLGASRLVQPDRAILWGVVLFALFIGGTQGFDLTNAIENLRVKMIETIAEGDDETSLIDLVAMPVGATPEETRQLNADDLMTLPKVMLQNYFIGLPEGSRCQGEGGGADECQKYRVIAFETNLAGQDLEYMFAAVKYKPDVIGGRQKQYISGLMRMVGALLAALVLMLFGIIFALLTAASLVLIIFFFAMLPLGFFDFGGTVLSGLIRQYTSVVGLSLFIAVMVRLMEGVTGTIFGAVSDFSDVLGLLTYLGMLLIIGLGLQMAVRTAWGVVDGAFTLLRTSVQAVGSLAFAAGGGPLGRVLQATSGGVKATHNTVVNTAMAAGAGLAAGGLGTAFMGGAGGLLSHTRTGRTIADVAEAAAPSSLGAQVFAAAVHSPGGWSTAFGVAAVSDRRREASLGQLRDGMRVESARIHPGWDAVDRGSHLTTDLNLLESAEQAYFQHHNAPQARITLERAFGSRAVADEVLGAYEIHGKAGAKQVRRVVEITQASVDDLSQRGRAIFDERGQLTPACESAIVRQLREGGVYPESDPHQSAFVGRLAGATLRRPVDVWEDPQAARKLAQDTFEPERTEVQVEDVPAQHLLRQSARQMGWNESTLAQAFAALPEARQRAAIQGRPVVEVLLETWRGEAEFQDEDQANLSQAARLVALVGASAQVQLPHPVPAERADLTPPVAVVRCDGSSMLVSAPYSADLAQQFGHSLPDQDCFWNLDQAEWDIAPQHEAAARSILESVAGENGWLVQESGPAEPSNAGVDAPALQAKPVDEPGYSTPEELEESVLAPVDMPSSAAPGPAAIMDRRLPEAAELQQDESLEAIAPESLPPTATRSQGYIPPTEAGGEGDEPLGEAVLEAAPQPPAPHAPSNPMLPALAGNTALKPPRPAGEGLPNPAVADSPTSATTPDVPRKAA